MLCPVCQIEMLILELHEVEIDWCNECHGIWLDEGELELLVAPLEDEALSPVVQALQDESASRPGKRPCPVCDKKMSRVELPLEPVVEIDKCPQGHGLWFDNGELEQINNSSGAEPVACFLDEIFGNGR